MYHHIQMYLEQLGYDIVEVILLFEKVDQNHDIHIHLHHSIPMNSSNGLFFKVMTVISLRCLIGTFLFIIIDHIMDEIYSNSLIVIEPLNP
ncbi:MAG: hypothetical protein E7H03_10890 [Staphylococcus epidermidis]|nr:hypothetical protein [Staphylococcus epidermidis]